MHALTWCWPCYGLLLDLIAAIDGHPVTWVLQHFHELGFALARWL